MRREKPVGVEHLVSLTSRVALSSPERAQHREHARSGDRLVKSARPGGVEGDGDHAGGYDRYDEFCDGEHFDQMDVGPEYPLEFGDPRCAAVDVVEHAYERDELPDWELVFELSRRATSAEADLARGAVGASRQA